MQITQMIIYIHLDASNRSGADIFNHGDMAMHTLQLHLLP
jgi:hypothetical protein